MDDYDLVYTILDEPVKDSWKHFAWFFAIGLIVYFYSKYIDKRQRKYLGQYLGLIWGIGFGLTALLIPLKSLYDLSMIKKKFTNNEFQIVEGTVIHFDPMPFEGHKRESFVVEGIKFAYTDYNDSRYGFRNTKSHGGPIDRNMYVRIGYVTEDGENRIWKIEIRR